MSNYPPGVTGRELEISGPDNEWEEHFECSNEKMEYVMITPYAHKFCSEMGKKIHRTLGQEELQKNWYHYASTINALFNMADLTSEIQIAECGYVGLVTKQSYRGEIWWNCPKCGESYEDEVDDYYCD